MLIKVAIGTIYWGDVLRREPFESPTYRHFDAPLNYCDIIITIVI
jgi:hypothetical protein